MASLAKEYGFSNVAIEDFPTGPDLAAGRRASCGSTAPRAEKLYDIHDIPESRRLDQRQRRHHRRAGRRRAGTAQDFEGKDVKGKFVLSTRAERARRRVQRAPSRPARSARSASARSAPATAPSTIRTRSSRPTVNAQPNTAAWALSPKKARELETMLEPRPEGHDPLDQQERAGARTSRRSSTPRFPATAARRRKSRSAGTSSRATSSRAPTTTTPAAR